MSEFGGGKTKVLRPRTSPELQETTVPEYSGDTGVVTVTRYLRGLPGIDGEDGLDGLPGSGTGGVPEDTTLAYNGSGQLITTTSPSGVTTLNYDVGGKLTSVVKPTYTKTLGYSPAGELLTVTIS